MSSLNWILSEGFLAIRFYDLPNLLICVLLLAWGARHYRLPALFTAILALHCVVPFFLNEVLFPTGYLGDQFRYWRQFNAIRAGDLNWLQAWFQQGNVEQAAALFALLPLPFAVSPISLGFFNTFLYLLLFFWLYNKGVFTRVSLWFFLLYPSMALYTGLSLRDTFIFLFMVMATQWAREGRWLPMLAVLYLLYEIKFQNFFILAPVLLIYLLFGIRHTGVSVGKGILTVGIAIVSLIVVSPVALPLINLFRSAMFREDGGDRDTLTLINTPTEFVLEGLTSGLYFLTKPWPWEASNALQLIQSAENLVIIVLLALLIYEAARRAPKHLVFWLLFFGFALSVYGLVVFNYGTAARYRYPFIMMFVLFVCADCRVHSLFRPIFPEKWRVRARLSASDGEPSVGCETTIQNHPSNKAN